MVIDGSNKNPSNFWFDSPAYFQGPKHYDFNYSYRSYTKIEAPDMGVFADAMKYSARRSTINTVIGGVFGLAAAAIFSRGGGGGGSSFDVGALLSGGGSYGGGTTQYFGGGVPLSSAPYTFFGPWKPVSGSNNPVNNDNNNNGGNNSVNNDNNNNGGNNPVNNDNNNNGGNNPVNNDNNNNNGNNPVNNNNGGGNGGGNNTPLISPEDFNSMIYDTYDVDGDGITNTIDADGKFVLNDKDDLIYARLGGGDGRHDTQSAHDISNSEYTQEAHHAGIKAGPAKLPEGAKADDKSDKGYLKYITLTAASWQKDNLGHLQSNSQLSFKFVSAGPEGIVYQLDVDASDLKSSNGVEYIDNLKEQVATNPRDYQYTITYNASGKYLDFGPGKTALAHVNS